MKIINSSEKDSDEENIADEVPVLVAIDNVAKEV